MKYLDESAFYLEEARHALDFGNDLIGAERRVRHTLSILANIGSSTVEFKSAEKELLAEASLLLARSLRLRGERPGARSWLGQAGTLWQRRAKDTPSSLNYTRLGEVLNTATLIGLNGRDDLNATAGEVERSLNLQVRLLREQSMIGVRDDYYLDAVQRLAEILRSRGDSTDAVELIKRTRYIQVANDMHEHSKALRTIVVNSALEARDLAFAEAYLPDLDRMQVVDESRFVGAQYAETQARYFTAAGDIVRARQSRATARRLRALEQLNDRALSSLERDI